VHGAATVSVCIVGLSVSNSAVNVYTEMDGVHTAAAAAAADGVQRRRHCQLMAIGRSSRKAPS